MTYNLGQSRLKSLFHAEAQRVHRENLFLRSPFLCVKIILFQMVYHYSNYFYEGCKNR
jgi:hypothetical protein